MEHKKAYQLKDDRGQSSLEEDREVVSNLRGCCGIAIHIQSESSIS